MTRNEFIVALLLGCVAVWLLAGWLEGFINTRRLAAWEEAHPLPEPRKVPAAVVTRPPAPVARADRQLQQARYQNEELSNAYTLLLAENNRLQRALDEAKGLAWPQNTIEIGPGDLIDAHEWEQFGLTVAQWEAEGQGKTMAVDEWLAEMERL